MSKPFNVTYNLRTTGEPVGLVHGTIMVVASDACAALLKATEILVDDEDIYEADWAAMNVDVQPAEMTIHEAMNGNCTMCDNAAETVTNGIPLCEACAVEVGS